MEKYNHLISNIWHILKNDAFLKKANTFYFLKNNNWGIINFQKSRSSDANEVLFTINLGVSSTIITKYYNGDLKQKPEIETSHWRKRIGHLLPEKKDYWWRINDETSLERLTSEILEILLKGAIPEILRHISDESLELEWLDEISSGLTELQRYFYLTVLLKSNKSEKLPLYIERLKLLSKGKVFEETVDDHIKRLGI